MLVPTAGIAVLIGLAALLNHRDKSTPSEAYAVQVKDEQRVQSEGSGPQDELPPRPRSEVGSLANKEPYDTGIANDPRVRHSEDGKHVFIEAISIAREIRKAGEDPERDLERLNEVISFYRRVFRQNPVAADNQSVMASLMGENSKALVFFPSDHPALNADGELIDPWGTPFHFHALSGTQMEIISPGPDHQLGNDDDLIHTPRDADQFFQGFTEEPPDPTTEE